MLLRGIIWKAFFLFSLLIVFRVFPIFLLFSIVGIPLRLTCKKSFEFIITLPTFSLIYDEISKRGFNY